MPIDLSYFVDAVNRIAGFGGIIDRVATAIREGLSTLTNNLRQIIQNVLSSLQSALSSRLSAIEYAITNFVNAFRQVLISVQSTLANAVNAVTSFLRDFISRITSAINNAISTIRNLFQSVATQLSNIANNVVNTLRQFFSTIFSNISGIIQNIVERVRSFLQSITDRIERFIDNIIDTIRKIVTGIWEFLKKIWQWIKEKVENAWKWVNEHIFKPFGETLDDTAEGIEKRWQALLALVNAVLANDGAGAVSAVRGIVGTTGRRDLSKYIIGAVLVHLMLSPVINAYATGMLNVLAQTSVMQNPVNPIPAESAVRGVFRGLMSSGDFAHNELKRGIAPELAHIEIESARPLPSPGVIQEGFVRGIIPENVHDSLLKKHGYTDSDIRLFKALYWVIPPLSDIIRMAVREVFTPEIAEKFGQYEDFPEVFAEWAEKQGLTREWAKRYWAAHWDLPSISQGYEMFHRGIIDENELKMLMRALDIMPFWREKLIQMSYSPLTRVDVRRMYAIGVIDEHQVYRAYRDLGYDDEKARWLTEFTKREYSPEEETSVDKYRQLTKGILDKAYRKHLLTPEEYKARLMDIGYSPSDAEFLLSLEDAYREVADEDEVLSPIRKRITNMVIDAYVRDVLTLTETRQHLEDLGLPPIQIEFLILEGDYQRTLSLKRLYVDWVKGLYTSYQIDESESRRLLSNIFPGAGEVDSLLETWYYIRETRDKIPSEATLRAFVKQGLLSVKDYANALRGMGYREVYVRCYLAYYFGVTDENAD